ncbi:family 16 glycosylhydrolase [Microbacterium sp. SD291]|uniref:family 16 glycosylhydrolase n=1 Tax=Microbacterium sp. SD291 TaxID=2782007 RepID=UPI0027DCCB0C|nr:family 16 glycosylhydrolase [Microbacterium sp. SD291]
MTIRSEPLPPVPRRLADFDDDFSEGLRPDRWVPHYLPHWSTPERSEARYGIGVHGLELRIEEDQPDWRPEDAPLRVSNVQTGTYSGPVGSARGTHRHRSDGLVVRTETPERLLFAPSRGRVDITVSASTDAGCMLAAWLVGVEHRSEDDAGEICIFEIDAEAVGATTTARTGVKAHHDPRMTTDMTEVVLPFDASRAHTWTAIWGARETVIGCDGVVVRRIPQAPDYPMLLLIDLFEVGGRGGTYPKTASVSRVTAWAE